MNMNSGTKNLNITVEDEINENHENKAGDISNEELVNYQNEDSINLDDAIDDDNENPVSQTLIDAAENIGPEEIRDTQELEGEEQESKDRVGSLSPLYKES